MFGGLSLIASIPLMCFPRYLKSKSRRKDLEKIGKELEEKLVTEKKSCGESVLGELKGLVYTFFAQFCNKRDVSLSKFKNIYLSFWNIQVDKYWCFSNGSISEHEMSFGFPILKEYK